MRHLLAHTSGLPDQRRYYQYLNDAGQLLAAALAEPLVAGPGTASRYSDVGFIVLGELAAAVAGCGLDDLAREVVCAPLGLRATRYLPPAEWSDRIAATELVGGAAKVGVVHDENAEMLGGVAGHAGLFGTAGDLAGYAAAWAGDGSPVAGLRAEALRCQTEALGGRRGLGWGLRHDTWDNMGDGWPASGAGHTGFTGPLTRAAGCGRSCSPTRCTSAAAPSTRSSPCASRCTPPSRPSCSPDGIGRALPSAYTGL